MITAETVQSTANALVQELIYSIKVFPKAEKYEIRKAVCCQFAVINKINLDQDVSQ